MAISSSSVLVSSVHGSEAEVSAPQFQPSAYPSSEQLQGGSTVLEVMTWLGLSLDSDITAAMLDHMGLLPSSLLKELAQIDKEEYEVELSEFRHEGKKAPLALRTKFKLLANLARVAFGLDYTPEQQRRWDEQQAHLDATLKKHQVVEASTAQTPTGQPASQGRKVSMRIAVQDRHDEVEIMDSESAEAARDRYLSKMHTRRIPFEDEPTGEQLATLRGHHQGRAGTLRGLRRLRPSQQQGQEGVSPSWAHFQRRGQARPRGISGPSEH